MEVEPHAVRWAMRKLKRTFSYEYTRWHYTKDASMTECGRPIAVIASSFLPESNEVSKVDCKMCLAALRRHRAA